MALTFHRQQRELAEELAASGLTIAGAKCTGQSTSNLYGKNTSKQNKHNLALPNLC